jgi:hypothetical protein
MTRRITTRISQDEHAAIARRAEAHRKVAAARRLAAKIRQETAR